MATPSSTTATATVSIPLTDLLLRPSTLQRFTKRGFESTDEIEESRANGGINLLASELDVSLQEAAGLIREVQGCLGTYEDKSRSNNSNTNNVNEESATNEDYNNNESHNDAHHQQRGQQQQQQQHDCGIVTAYELLRMNDYRRSISSDGTTVIARTPGKKHNRRQHIVTFCRSIDDLLGGGISLGQVTELAGLPGTGKTQLATQLSVLARLPHLYGGVEGRTLYVDAEGSFVAERACSMAKALHHHVRGRAQHQHQRGRKSKRDRNRGHTIDDDTGDSSIPTDFATEEILDSIDVFRVHDETALLATLYSLRHYIESSASSPKSTLQAPSSSSSSLPVKLIVIDSIAFHFRAVIPTSSSYYVQRTKTLTALAAYLGDLAQQHDLAVVVINQMTTKMSNNNTNGNGNGNDNSSGISNAGVSVVPALGESWAHATATR